MKATRQDPPPPQFIPVTLTLETQEEVDVLYGLMNHVWVADGLLAFASTQGTGPTAEQFRFALSEFITRKGADAAFAAFRDTFKALAS